MKLKVLFGIVMSILILTIVGCGGGGSSTPSTKLTGEVTKGPISGADVMIFAINDGIVSTTPLTTRPAKVTTNAFGNYSAVISYAGPVKVVVTGNSGSNYTDEATNTVVDFTGKKLSAVVANVTGTTNIAVTPHTELAVQAAAATPLTPANITKANIAVAAALRIPDVDIVATSPSTSPVYKFALGVISQTAGTTATGLSDKLTTIAAGIDVTLGTIKDPAVSALLAIKTGEAYQNPNIRPTGTTIPGVVETAVSGVNITAPTTRQQNITTLAPTAAVAISAAVTQVNGLPSKGTNVTFTITSGTGTFANITTVSVPTGDDGVAKVNLSSAVEGTVGFTATAGILTSSSTVIFEDLNKPGAVTLTAVPASGVTQGKVPVTLSATVSRLGSVGGPVEPVPDGTDVTFIITGTTGVLTPTTSKTIAGVATAVLNSNSNSQLKPADSITVTAKAGTITSLPMIVNFIFQPVSATLALSTPATLTAGITKITSITGTLLIMTAGVTVNPVANSNSATGSSAGPGVVTPSGAAPANTVVLPAEFTSTTVPATPAAPDSVLVSLVSINGFAPGEFATIVTNLANVIPLTGDFKLSPLFTVTGLDANGVKSTVTVPVTFTLTYQ